MHRRSGKVWMGLIGPVNLGFAFFLERFKVTTPDEWTDRG